MVCIKSLRQDYENTEMPLLEICKKHGLKRSTFYTSYFPKFKRRGSGKRITKSQEKINCIISDYFSNELKVKEVAKKHSCAINTVYRYIKLNGHELKGVKCTS